MAEPRCPFCRSASSPVLLDRPDHEYGVEARLDYHRCRGCQAVFVEPMPTAEEIGGFYTAYSTHGAEGSRGGGVLTRWSERVTRDEFEDASPAWRDAPVLDYGCGDGDFIAKLVEAGHQHVVGYDFDPAAVAAARRTGATIVDDEDRLAELGPFGTITLNHVVEHLADPVADLARLGRLLAPGGRLVIRTPNARSALSRLLKDAWRGWETPRHLHVLTPRAVRALVDDRRLADLRLVSLDTSEAMLFGIFHESLRGERWRRPAAKVGRHVAALTLRGLLTPVAKVRAVGEELVVVLERR